MTQCPSPTASTTLLCTKSSTQIMRLPQFHEGRPEDLLAMLLAENPLAPQLHEQGFSDILVKICHCVSYLVSELCISMRIECWCALMSVSDRHTMIASHL